LHQLHGALDKWARRGIVTTVDTAVPVTDGILDLRIVEGLKEVTREDGTSILGELVDRFVTSGADQLAEVKQAVEGRDVEKVKTSAHKLKGSASTLGASELCDACKHLEEAADVEAPVWESLDKSVVGMERLLALSIESLRREVVAS
jgi:HPt (histidine-containing phosphotransfer) domain-containing protein